jgi:hypothetical protein
MGTFLWTTSVTTTSGKGSAPGAAALLQPDGTTAIAAMIDTLTMINRLPIEFDPLTGW